MTRRYFDNAATSFPKPPGVAAAMLRFMEECGAPGRGGYAEAREAGRIIRECRRRIARLIGGDSERPEQVIFTLNTTDALNLAIKGAVQGALESGSRRVHVVTTWMEHNSVLRPMHALADRLGRVDWTRVEADPASGLVDPADLVRAIRPGETALVIVNHASNVTGTVQPIASGEVGRACREAGALFLVDAAQSLGHIDVNVEQAAIDLLAFPGHKGLLGPQGTGGLYIRPGVEERLATVREGGTGSVSEEQTHPRMMPERFEAGSHNTVGIAGLAEGAAWLLDRSAEAVRKHEIELMRPMLDAAGGGEFAGLRLLGPSDERDRVGVFSFVHDELTPLEMAMLMEGEYGILGRAGLHCAPLAHETFGTSPGRRGVGGTGGGGGAFRLSLGPFLTPADVGAAIAALREACAAHRPTAALGDRLT